MADLIARNCIVTYDSTGKPIQVTIDGVNYKTGISGFPNGPANSTVVQSGAISGVDPTVTVTVHTHHSGKTTVTGISK